MNTFQTECYFISKELKKLCEKSDQIIINIDIEFPHNSLPKFRIIASKFPHFDVGDDVIGCPMPCLKTKKKN